MSVAEVPLSPRVPDLIWIQLHPKVDQKGDGVDSTSPIKTALERRADSAKPPFEHLVVAFVEAPVADAAERPGLAAEHLFADGSLFFSPEHEVRTELVGRKCPPHLADGVLNLASRSRSVESGELDLATDDLRPAEVLREAKQRARDRQFGSVLHPEIDEHVLAARPEEVLEPVLKFEGRRDERVSILAENRLGLEVSFPIAARLCEIVLKPLDPLLSPVLASRLQAGRVQAESTRHDTNALATTAAQIAVSMAPAEVSTGRGPQARSTVTTIPTHRCHASEWTRELASGHELPSGTTRIALRPDAVSPVD